MIADRAAATEPQPTPTDWPTAVAALEALACDRDVGLTGAEAAARLAREGPNEAPEPKSHPILAFARKFWGLSAWMIELIAAISAVLHKTTDLLIALALLVVNAVLSFLEEQRASSAVSALRNRLQVTARARRERCHQDALPDALPARGGIARRQLDKSCRATRCSRCRARHTSTLSIRASNWASKSAARLFASSTSQARFWARTIRP